MSAICLTSSITTAIVIRTVSTVSEEEENTKFKAAQLRARAEKRETVLSNFLVWVLGWFEFISWDCLFVWVFFFA